MRVAMYLRQSYDPTSNELGVGRQREAVEAFTSQRGWPIVRTYVDNDVSATARAPRPEFEAMLADVATGQFDVIVARHMDRLLRRLTELERVLDVCSPHGVHVVTAQDGVDTSTDGGRLVARILGSVAQGEVERKAARQRAAALQAAEQGAPIPRRRFGFEADGKTHRPDEAEAVRWVFHDFLAGESQGAIVQALNDAGFRTARSGSLWNRSSLRALLLNPAHAGLRLHRPTDSDVAFSTSPQDFIVGRGQWEPIVSEDVWRAAAKMLTDPARWRAPNHGKALLTGVAQCECGATVVSTSVRGGVRAYRCPQTSHVTRRAEPIERYVEDVMVARLSLPDAAEVFAPEEGAAGESAEADVLRRRLEDVAEDYADGAITRRQFQVASERIKARLVDLEARIASALARSAAAQVVSAADVGVAWAELPVVVRRGLIRQWMRVQILPVGRGVRTFRSESVLIEWLDR